MASKSLSDQGIKTQEYFVYFKFFNAELANDLPSDAEGV